MAVSDTITRPISAPADFSSTMPPSFLDWNTRPKSIQDKISATFSSFSGCWRQDNQCAPYYIGGINEFTLLKKIILSAPASQKQFYALNIGVTNCTWHRS